MDDLALDQSELFGSALQSLEVLARALHLKDAALPPTLDAIVTSATETVDAARYAGLILLDGGTLTPQATTGRPPYLLDTLQQELGDGPCLDAARRQATNRIDDTKTDPRWPQFGAEAAELGVCSMLCVPLWVHEQCLGALTLYAERSDAFTRLDERLAHLFGTLAALAIAEAQRVGQLRTAMANRDVIGQAKGILMERHRLTADAAFHRLAEASQRVNKKLVVVAAHVAATGELPT